MYKYLKFIKHIKFFRCYSFQNRPTDYKIEPIRRMVIMSHAEPVDSVFGQNWWKNVIDKKTGTYVRKDLNLPTDLIKRNQMVDYQHDPPLTVIGEFQSEWVGYSLLINTTGFNFKHVFASCALRSVLTATHLLKGMENTNLKINIEPGLYHWPHWNQRVVPNWMSDSEFKETGLVPVNNYTSSYTRQMLLEKIPSETFEEYNKRIDELMVTICKATENDWGDILVIAHHDSINVCSRNLTGKPRLKKPHTALVEKFAFCSMLTILQKLNSKWVIDYDVLPNFTHLSNIGFDYIVNDKLKDKLTKQ